MSFVYFSMIFFRKKYRSITIDHDSQLAIAKVPMVNHEELELLRREVEVKRFVQNVRSKQDREKWQAKGEHVSQGQTTKIFDSIDCI